MAHSSPEPAARWFGEGVWGERVGVLRTQREL
jgi:transposase